MFLANPCNSACPFARTLELLYHAHADEMWSRVDMLHENNNGPKGHMSKRKRDEGEEEQQEQQPGSVAPPPPKRQKGRPK